MVERILRSLAHHTLAESSLRVRASSVSEPHPPTTPPPRRSTGAQARLVYRSTSAPPSHALCSLQRHPIQIHSGTVRVLGILAFRHPASTLAASASGSPPEPPPTTYQPSALPLLPPLTHLMSSYFNHRELHPSTAPIPTTGLSPNRCQASSRTPKFMLPLLDPLSSPSPNAIFYNFPAVPHSPQKKNKGKSRGKQTSHLAKDDFPAKLLP
ncbi:hypothetical protein Pyn_00890 [Prunus yedoensis var. nudiflora]|uniref:Uncharacterized protein n=1 Tax=Prunus yedoensis var. nudiflora TaxID=2094558 RepID=A0A314YLE0_PRUYE|nr:hypothetical protein Pyn_00890 [Prunus yedoensis var. nudiflora]